jgi:exonuclease III
MKVIIWNVDGITALRGGTFKERWMQEQRPEIILLTETQATAGKGQDIKNYKQYVAPAEKAQSYKITTTKGSKGEDQGAGGCYQDPLYTVMCECKGVQTQTSEH